MTSKVIPAIDLDIDHICDSIKKSRVYSKPYSYLICDNVFSPEDYKKIISYFPEKKYFSTVAPSVSRLDLIADPASHGKGDWTIDTHLTELTTAQLYWYGFRDLFMGSRVMHSIMQALNLPIEGEYSASARLAIDHHDAGLGPHTDRIDKLVSAIFYLAEPDQLKYARAAGTQVLVPKNPDMEFTVEHYTYSEFDIHEYVEYLPNRLFAFAVSSGENGIYSFHGYHQEADFERKTIKYHVHNPAFVAEGIAQNNLYKQRARNWIEEKKQITN